jgi:hypothetical protein
MYYFSVRKIMLISSLCLFIFMSLPNKYQLDWYFKTSPKLHINSIRQQAKLILPEIPDGIKGVVFVDEETYILHKDVSVFQIPPFWWHTGFGTMFRMLYNRQDIKFEISSNKAVRRERNTIFVRVAKGPADYSLSLMKP